MKFCVQIWTFHKLFFISLGNLSPTSHVGGETLFIPGRVSFHLHFIQKVCLVLWKLSLEGFHRCFEQ